VIEVTMRQMLEAGVHFGHQTRNWNPKMAPYIYGSRHKIHIINLEQTLPLFQQAIKFVANLASKRGKVLFVGTKFAARDIVREEATRCGMPYVDYRWTGGMLTNYKTIRQSIKRLKELEELMQNEHYLSAMTKKEVLNLMREKDKLSANLSGIKNMGSLPDALFVIDVGHEKIAVQEAKRLGIPVVAIVDTNANPDGIDYLIPGNDDAIRSIHFYCSTLADIIVEARGAIEFEEAKEGQKKEKGASSEKKIVTKKVKREKVADQPTEKEITVTADLEENETAIEAEAKPISSKKKSVKKKGVEKQSTDKKGAAEQEKTDEQASMTEDMGFGEATA